jgi:hypothetical protein
MYLSTNDAPGYILDGDAFTPTTINDIQKTTRLHKSGWLGDWWVHESNNPKMTWAQLIDLALCILHTEATRLFVASLHLKTMPVYTLANDLPLLPTNSVRGAKRINAWCEGNVCTVDEKFRLFGKDESCCVEGTWLDWCCFACNVLSSQNTKAMCADLYEPMLANSNY